MQCQFHFIMLRNRIPINSYVINPFKFLNMSNERFYFRILFIVFGTVLARIEIRIILMFSLGSRPRCIIGNLIKITVSFFSFFALLCVLEILIMAWRLTFGTMVFGFSGGAMLCIKLTSHSNLFEINQQQHNISAFF